MDEADHRFYDEDKCDRCDKTRAEIDEYNKEHPEALKKY